jgi:hypothetical protein
MKKNQVRKINIKNLNSVIVYIVMSKFIKNISRYNYFVVHKGKPILLAGMNDKLIAKQKAEAKIKSQLESFKNKNIIFMRVSKVDRKLYKESKLEGNLTSIGGPIKVDISILRITRKGFLKVDENDDRNNTVFVSEEFLKNNNHLSVKDLRKIAQKVAFDQLDKSLLAINIL